MSSPPSTTGLSNAAAAARLAADGPNELPRQQQRWRDMLLAAMREPMFRLLMAAAALYLLLGERNEGLFLLSMVLAVLGLTLYQARKTAGALEKLRELSSPSALVMRDGQRRQVDSRELVVGDVIVLDEGQRVPADADLMQSSELQVDESLLSGESFPVDKQAGSDSGRLFAGSLVIAGHALACVTATGSHTAVGRIGSTLLELEPARSPMQEQIARLTKTFAWSGMALSAALVLLLGLVRGDWLQALLAGIALAMSMLPEEFPVVLTVFPALGAWRLARSAVLTRRLDAIATLGSISVLCVDKTGTLTENRMAVARVYAQDQSLDTSIAAEAWPAAHRELLHCAQLASASAPVDPMEVAIAALHRRLEAGQPSPARTAVREYGLSPALRVMSRAWQSSGRPACLVAAKGAPEAVIALCKLPPQQVAELTRQTAAMASAGLRVLGVAWANADGQPWPADQTGFDYHFAGLLGLADPLRPDIPAAVAQCHDAGIRVLMVTGDHPVTAAAIASQAGLPAGGVLTGAQLDQLSDRALRRHLRDTGVYARITPLQKLRIIQALQADGAVVAMTGDGVNDAPALKAAHVGIAMGLRGTDVARAAAALVLMDDRFSTIVQAIRSGRRIYDNMRKALGYIIATHVPIAGMAVLPVLLGMPPMMYPMHIVFLELIIDPACSLAFENEPEESGAMTRPPRRQGAPLLDRNGAVQALAQGGAALLLTLAVYATALATLGEPQARALAFGMLVISNLLLITSHRAQRLAASWRAPNAIAWSVSGAAMALLALSLYLPVLAGIFRFAPPPAPALAAMLAVSALSLACFEMLKRYRGAP